MLNWRMRLFGFRPSDLAGKPLFEVASLYSAQQEMHAGALMGFASLVCIIGGVYVIFWHGDIMIPVSVASLCTAVVALASVRVAIAMPMFQLVQAEQSRAESARLATAIEELTKELRQRRDPLAVSFSLFGPGR
jgi:hypothetical protein